MTNYKDYVRKLMLKDLVATLEEYHRYQDMADRLHARGMAPFPSLSDLVLRTYSKAASIELRLEEMREEDT